MNDQLDRAVRSVLTDIISTAPARDEQPIRTVGIEPPSRTGRPYFMVAAAVMAVVGVGGVALVSSRDPGTTDTATPTAILPVASGPEASAAPPAALVGELLTADLGVDAVPLVVPGGSGWNLTAAFSSVGAPLAGGFEGATVFVGVGPTYDAPLFAATVVVSSSGPDGTQVTVPSIDALLQDGDPVAVAGTTGAVTVTEFDGDTGFAGPSVTLFWPIDANTYARVNTVRLNVDQAVAFANQLQLIDGRLTMNVPDGYRELAVPAIGDRRHISYRFADSSREIELIGENRGVASLLGRIAGEVRTTRVVGGVEVAFRPQPETPSQFWADWQSGEWSFYAIASGFESEEQFLSELASLTLTDPATFEAAGASIGVVMPGVHNDLAARALDTVGLSNTAFADAATTDLPMSADSYGFELLQGAACVWHERWTDTSDTSVQQTIANDIEQTIAATTGTDFERAADLILVPLLDTVSGHQPSTEISYAEGCPAWVAAGG